ncbi:MAG: chaperone modulator CbpM [Nitrospirales bacterium]|nr:chaperone modulator CbpM [Nitrospirales bacterium]
MTEEAQPTLEQVTAEIITSGSIRREEVCARLGIGEDVLEVCLRWEIIQPPEPDPQGTVFFSEDALDRLGRGLRLHRDLGINWPGVSVALELLDRIEELEQQIHNFSNE